MKFEQPQGEGGGGKTKAARRNNAKQAENKFRDGDLLHGDRGLGGEGRIIKNNKLAAMPTKPVLDFLQLEKKNEEPFMFMT